MSSRASRSLIAQINSNFQLQLLSIISLEILMLDWMIKLQDILLGLAKLEKWFTGDSGTVTWWWLSYSKIFDNNTV